MDQAWKVRDRREVLDARPFFSVAVEDVELPDGRRIGDYWQIDMGQFACVFPVLEDGRVMVFRHYRHGPRKVCLTFPGGQIDPGETPLAAAKRELMEELGFEAARWIPLGGYVINANQGCGMAHLFRAEGCRRVAAPDAGDLEDLTEAPMTLDELFAEARAGGFAIMNQLALLTLATHPELQA